MVKDAISYENATGNSGLNLSPRQLMMKLRVLRRDEKNHRILLAQAISIHQSGDQKMMEELYKG
jgi:hypothetical protein